MTKVHLVGNPDKDNVVIRLMVALAQKTGWSMGRNPDPSADINYFWLYVTYAQGMDKLPKLKGKTATMFSHYEDNRPEKQDWWHKAAESVDIRLTWSPKYVPMLERYGETHLVMPSIEAQFMEDNPCKVIGISGYVHPGGRKGEHLWTKLYEDSKKRNWWLKASGKGWVANNLTEYTWEQMPDFYKSLDVYVCTSFIEGIPLPPLEALACGVPVVVPRGVGIMDYLEDTHVYRYDKGDYDSLFEAIQTALFPSRTVSQFSAWNAAESYKIAFGLSENAPIALNVAKKANTSRFAPKNTHYDVSESGAVVIAYGEPARHCAETMLLSWRKEMPDYPIALISDSPIGIETDFIQHEDADIGARSIKTRLYDLAPKQWKRILYLDADTEIVNDISVLFHWLKDDGFEFLICTNPDGYKTLEAGKRPDNVEETDYTIQQLGNGGIVQPNGGVFGFRRNAITKKFFKAWHTEWQRWGKRDQHALLRAMRQVPLRWLLLNNWFNTIVKSDGTRYGNLPIENTAGIYHHVMKARRWEGIIEGRLDSDEAWLATERWRRKNE